MNLIKIFCFFPLFSHVFFNDKPLPEKSFINSNSVENSDVCNKSIKFIIEKIIMTEDQREINTTIEMIINSKAKKINLSTYSRKKGKINFDTDILSFQCSLNENITSGEAIYKGYVLSQDGTKSNSTIHIRIKDGNIFIDESDPEKGRQPNYTMVVSKWVILD